MIVFNVKLQTVRLHCQDTVANCVDVKILLSPVFISDAVYTTSQTPALSISSQLPVLSSTTPQRYNQRTGTSIARIPCPISRYVNLSVTVMASSTQCDAVGS